METAIIVAIVSSVSSVIIVIINSIHNRKITKLSRENAELLEKLKFDIETKRTLRSLIDEDLKRKLSALAVLIELIQKCKDAIFLIESSQNTHYDSQLAKQSIDLAYKEYSECYRKEIPFLEKEENTIAHDVKNIFSHALHNTERVTQNQFVEVDEHDVIIFKLIKANLTEQQNKLRDMRANILISINVS